MSVTGLSSTPRPLLSPLRFVPYAVDAWCPVIESGQLTADRPATTELLGRRLVLFREPSGAVSAMEDRCPHRGVALSLGEVRPEGIRCSYHGWTVAPGGCVTSAPGITFGPDAPRVRSFAARDAVGLIWVFIGAPEHASRVPLPTGSFGTGAGADLLLSMEVDAHWSFVLDNGLDLFHQHLHREVPFFFEAHALEGFGPDGEAFTVSYDATLRDALNLRRKGRIAIRLEHNCLALDFGGFPLIRGITTPRSANGRRVTAWWLVTFPAGPLFSFGLKAWMPKIRGEMLRGFHQDKVVLESENAAFERDPATPQLEVNPVIPAAHEHLENVIRRRGKQIFDGDRTGIVREELSAEQLLARVARGEAAVLAQGGGGAPELVPPRGLKERLSGPGLLAPRYEHFHFLFPPDQIQAK